MNYTLLIRINDKGRRKYGYTVPGTTWPARIGVDSKYFYVKPPPEFREKNDWAIDKEHAEVLDLSELERLVWSIDGTL